MERPLGCFDSPTIKLEAEGEGIYASTTAAKNLFQFQDPETDQGLTLPPEIQSNDVWPFIATSSHEESFSGLLGGGDVDFFGEDLRINSWVSTLLDEEYQSPEPPSKRRKPTGDLPHLDPFEHQVPNGDSISNLPVSEEPPLTPCQLASENVSPSRPAAHQSPSDFGHGHSIPEVSVSSVAHSSQDDQPPFPSSVSAPSNGNGDAIQQNDEQQPNGHPIAHDSEPELNHDHNSSSFAIDDDQWQDSAPESGESSFNDEYQGAADVPMPSIEEDLPRYPLKPGKKIPFWLRPVIATMECDKCDGRGQLYMNQLSEQGTKRANASGAERPSTIVPTTLGKPTILGETQPSSANTATMIPSAEDSSSHKTKSPAATQISSSFCLLANAIEFARTLLPTPQIFVNPDKIERDRRALDGVYRSFLLQPEFRQNTCNWVIEKMEELQTRMTAAPASARVDERQIIEDLKCALQTERAKHAKEILLLQQEGDGLKRFIQSQNRYMIIERTRLFVALHKHHGDAAAKIKITITPTAISKIPQVALPAQGGNPVENPFWLCCNPFKGREAYNTRHPQCLGLNTQFQIKYRSWTERLKCVHCNGDAKDQRYYIDDSTARFLGRACSIPTPPKQSEATVGPLPNGPPPKSGAGNKRPASAIDEDEDIVFMGSVPKRRVVSPNPMNGGPQYDQAGQIQGMVSPAGVSMGQMHGQLPAHGPVNSNGMRSNVDSMPQGHPVSQAQTPVFANGIANEHLNGQFLPTQQANHQAMQRGSSMPPRGWHARQIQNSSLPNGVPIGQINSQIIPNQQFHLQAMQRASPYMSQYPQQAGQCMPSGQPTGQANGRLFMNQQPNFQAMQSGPPQYPQQVGLMQNMNMPSGYPRGQTNCQFPVDQPTNLPNNLPSNVVGNSPTPTHFGIPGGLSQQYPPLNNPAGHARSASFGGQIAQDLGPGQPNGLTRFSSPGCSTTQQQPQSQNPSNNVDSATASISILAQDPELYNKARTANPATAGVSTSSSPPVLPNPVNTTPRPIPHAISTSIASTGLPIPMDQGAFTEGPIQNGLPAQVDLTSPSPSIGSAAPPRDATPKRGNPSPKSKPPRKPSGTKRRKSSPSPPPGPHLGFTISQQIKTSLQKMAGIRLKAWQIPAIVIPDDNDAVEPAPKPSKPKKHRKKSQQPKQLDIAGISSQTLESDATCTSSPESDITEPCSQRSEFTGRNLDANFVGEVPAHMARFKTREELDAYLFGDEDEDAEGEDVEAEAEDDECWGGSGELIMDYGDEGPPESNELSDSEEWKEKFREFGNYYAAQAAMREKVSAEQKAAAQGSVGNKDVSVAEIEEKEDCEFDLEAELDATYATESQN